ncbi:VOC family protein [Alteribacillus sp. HJP-4]|uniref:VOC family protein n=1 Tax=Alteribacillus sp. HJP-4 TaxID=2775394 RepID=UPI0035CCED29
MKEKLHHHTEIGYVQLKVAALERSAKFYKEIIGFRVEKEEENKVYLTAANDQKTLLILEEVQGVRPQPRHTAGLYHFAILVPDRESLAVSLRHLLEKKTPLQGASDHLFSEAVYLQDPDNNGIEIYADRPREQWETQANGKYKAATVPLHADDMLQLADEKVWQGLPAETKIGHIHLHVGDLAAAQSFYVDGIGFETTIHMGEQALFVAAGGYHHHVGMNTWAGQGVPKPPENAAGLRYYTIVLQGEEELTAVTKRLERTGFHAEKTAGGVFAADPFGNTIKFEIQ